MAQLARAGPWIDPFLDGLDTHVGEHGERLSGGRRLAFRCDQLNRRYSSSTS